MLKSRLRKEYNLKLMFVPLQKVFCQFEVSANIKYCTESKIQFEYKTPMSDNVMLFNVFELE